VYNVTASFFEAVTFFIKKQLQLLRINYNYKTGVAKMVLMW